MKTEFSRGLLALVFSTGMLAAGALAASPDESAGITRDVDRVALQQLNEELARSQIVDRDPAFIAKVALENFRVLAPGGLFENKYRHSAGIRRKQTY